jgi:SSS family solute:Na+ symporter
VNNGSFGRLSGGMIILPLYFAVTLCIGWIARRQSRSSNAYLNASRSLPLGIVCAAYLASNCGALEIVGLSAMAAQYGARAFHFYWIGAIPAMVFLALCMMPVYRAAGVNSVPEYLAVRYGPYARLLNSCVVAIMMLLLGGISLYAMAQVLEVIAGVHFVTSVLISASVVLTYVLLGGIKATIYNEVFQLVVMLAGLVPLAIRNFRFALPSTVENARAHLWLGTPLVSQSAPMDGLGIVFGLGFVLSFSYWCTDFVLMQRAFTARTEADARQVPLWAGFGKLLFSFLVVVPGLAAFKLFPSLGHEHRFDQALPMLITVSYGPIMLGLGLTALVASLMSGLAANVSAFASVWTDDIYCARLRPSQSDRHYLKVGRSAAALAVLISALASYMTFLFHDLMEHVQLIFSVFGAPFWAIFLLGITTRRTTERGAILGFCSGTAVALLHLLAVTQGWLHYGTLMNANFHAASYAFCVACAVAWVASGQRTGTGQRSAAGAFNFNWRAGLNGERLALLWTLSTALLLACIALNILWR